MIALIGVLHTVLGVVNWIAAPPTATQEQLMLCFWFTAFGVVAIVLGVAVAEVGRARGYVPPTVLLGLVALFAFGVAVVPASGFWSLLLPLTTGTVGWLSARRASGVQREMSQAGHLG